LFNRDIYILERRIEDIITFEIFLVRNLLKLLERSSVSVTMS